MNEHINFTLVNETVREHFEVLLLTAIVKTLGLASSELQRSLLTELVVMLQRHNNPPVMVDGNA